MPTLVEAAVPSPGGADSGGSAELEARYVPGTIIAGRYRVVSLAGRGGMGEVYRADDLKIGQAVALKFLPEEIERRGGLERFLAEVRLARQISHPGVARVYDVGEVDDRHFLSMEYVDGEDLASLLRRIGRLPEAKAIQIGRQLASGLAAAHEAGVLHRDLKPANVMLDSRGRAKIMDFGLAVPTEDAGRKGGLVGTPAYMAPEQLAKGAVSEKTDIYSLGLILYELAIGSDALRAKLEQGRSALDQPDPEVPLDLDEIIRRCLEESPANRVGSASDLASELRAVAPSTMSSVSAFGSPAGHRRRSFGWVLSIALAAFAGLGGYSLGKRAAPFESPKPPKIRALTFSGNAKTPSASPDGRTIAFESNRGGTSRIWLKQIDGGEAPLTDGFDISPTFSPDGSTVAFMRVPAPGARPTIYVQPVVGGQPRPVVTNADVPEWSPDGEEILFVRRSEAEAEPWNALTVVPVTGGGAVEILRDERFLWRPNWSSGGLIAARRTAPGVPDGILVADRSGGAVRVIEIETGRPDDVICGVTWSPSGELLYLTAENTRHAPGLLQAYDLDSGRRREIAWIERGSAMTVLDTVGDGVVFDLVDDFQTLTEYSSTGDSKSLTVGSTFDRQPVVSPDGRHVLFTSQRAGNMDLWLLERATGRLSQVTFDQAFDWDPAFTAGGGLLWSSDRADPGVHEIWTASLDGTGARQLSSDGVYAQNPSASPDRQVDRLCQRQSDPPGSLENACGRLGERTTGRHRRWLHTGGFSRQSLGIVSGSGPWEAGATSCGSPSSRQALSPTSRSRSESPTRDQEASAPSADPAGHPTVPLSISPARTRRV